MIISIITIKQGGGLGKALPPSGAGGAYSITSTKIFMKMTNSGQTKYRIGERQWL